MTHISLDLETMGTGPMSSILSIGAVVFELDGTYTNLSGPAFYTTIDLKSCEDRGLRIDASTVKWWATQSDEARRVITDPDALLLAHALHQSQLLHHRARARRFYTSQRGMPFY